MRSQTIWMMGWILTMPLLAMDLRLEINLQGQWKFEIGDNPNYSKPDHDDRHWEKILVPGMWENQGFPGYDGYAWYRRKVKIPKHLRDNELYLCLGRIDDVDRTYLNGHFIGGEGSFFPNYQSAWEKKRAYKLPKQIIRFGEENVIAVRVFDVWGGGGIITGEVGIYSRMDALELDIDLSGEWAFRFGDDLQWASGKDSKSWQKMRLPNYWENQGYRVDGFAWFQREVRIPKSLFNKKLILLLGKIDDTDETYFNGVLIGRTGQMMPPKTWDQKWYKEERAYLIPPNLIRWDQSNHIAIRIRDFGGKGGLYDGPTGILTREKYLQYVRTNK